MKHSRILMAMLLCLGQFLFQDCVGLYQCFPILEVELSILNMWVYFREYQEKVN